MMHLSEQAFTGIARLMHEVAGLSFNPSKKPLIASRLAPRIQGLGLPGFEAYLQLIQSPGQQRELQVSIDLLTTNETYFFREPAHFERLEQEIKSGPRREVKVWCGASSYGDEPYTIAMVLADLCASGHVADNWSVVGTDISEKVLRHAVTGIFPLSRLQRVSPQRLKRYCLRGDDEAEGLVKKFEALSGLSDTAPASPLSSSCSSGSGSCVVQSQDSLFWYCMVLHGKNGADVI